MKYLRIMLLAMIVSLLAACGSAQASNNEGPVDVQVKLSEMKIEASRTAFSEGVPYRFVVTNAGALAHEFMIVPTAISGGMMGTAPMEQMDAKALARIDSDDLPPGATKTLDYTFTTRAPAGSLEFACYVPGHRESGMYQAITVQ